jgi:hypothetical protein
MRTYRIYTENKNRECIELAASKAFESFTIYSATGYWQGAKENSLVIEIIQFIAETWFQRKVNNLARVIKCFNEQQAVLVTCNDTDTGELV